MNRWSSILTHTAAAMSCILSHCHQSHDSYHSALYHDDWVKKWHGVDATADYEKLLQYIFRFQNTYFFR